MWLVQLALRRPVTIVVAVIALILAAGLALQRMAVDIFPQVGSPTIYVAQPYGGMDPQQMEGFLTYYYEYHFLYITGIEHVESKNIQGAALMKLVFHPGTDMNQAMAQTIGYVNRARSFMPPGAVQPFVTRFDAGSVPVGQLIFSSPTRPPAEMQDIALNRVRPIFATLPGVSAPPPFGGNQRTIVVRLDPEKLRAYRMSPEEVIAAVNRASTVIPSGVVRTGDFARIANSNAVVGGNLQELADAPVRVGTPSVYVRDVAVVENGTDIITAYALVNGKRTVYMQVTKRSDASTLDVIQAVRAALPQMKAVCPEDVDVRLEFDQSGVVRQSIRSLTTEAILGALLTGLMVLLFLRDPRGAAIVVLTIPCALMGAVFLLWVTGQTINIMTLGGLALAVGVLVDEATVEIENIHTQMARGQSRARAVLDACKRTALPRLLSMLSVLAVFVPSFFMPGTARQLFVPLSLAVGFSMVTSYVLSSTLVPVLASWLMKHSAGEATGAGFYRRYLGTALKLRWPLVAGYLAGATLILLLVAPRLGRELFPPADALQFQLRLRAPTGTRIERTELVALKALDIIKSEVGAEQISISSGFVGVQPASYPINTVYLWTSGPQEAVLLVALKPEAKKTGAALRESLRGRLARELPGVQATFEAGDIVSQVMSFGSPTPIEVAVQGPAMPANREHAAKVRAELAKIPALRDLASAQPLDYPTLEVQVDRDKAGSFGLTAQNVVKSLMTATSSSRFVEPNYWRDPVSGNGFQIQVEIPQHKVGSMDDVASLPVMQNGAARPWLGDVAQLKYGTMPGQVDRYNMQRVVSFTANVHGVPLGEAVSEIEKALKRAGAPPRGVTVQVRGQVPVLREVEKGLSTGLQLAIGAIFLLLAANFQSARLAISVILIVPAALSGTVLALWLTGTTLNVQSFMGAIMAVGISVANSILLVSFSENARHDGRSSQEAALEGGSGRLRAIVMTASAMIAGMVPIALGAPQTAPLGRAVIGGLALSTFATLTVLPSLYAILQARAPRHSVSLDPNDPTSRYHEAA
jgi:multidrug efflux pump subunit AcrB